jgi:hypothetical protein
VGEVLGDQDAAQGCAFLGLHAGRQQTHSLPHSVRI